MAKVAAAASAIKKSTPMKFSEGGKMKRIIIVSLVIIAMLVWASIPIRPEMVIADKDISPANLRDGMGQKTILSSQLPPEKYVKRYRYLLCSAEGAKLDGKKYLKQFPKDAVVKTSMGKGEEYLRIFTDILPDPNAVNSYTESIEKAKWLRVQRY